ncbi:hypothetical protein JCM15457_2508 [Liquorilactobacillus sucicola DSM 21376 = JCM 15457]|uniref:DUF3781 domain-containing protein n=1 Tax=Liquorilactobacillus sucicola DSM 21376 = JCM 15457 TaxID=1423806 RepID=A0A023D0Z7_9LACO|nr:DUF3781 domain-containing protein [Liquorilactobacillus sucicola]KRN07362.1 hypothetical protein FD15_GL002309 [Liquorilactobacillus sucicola DSM 21376 = JCM 15457]GAJ27506.1 hypothetical protein JCM15457_2508 [Liquorilactobacillus sucicola DSM 21376 = JCM 15457]
MTYPLLEKIAEKLCYTDLGYQRINKKLKLDYSRNEIESLLQKNILSATRILHKGKNYYIYNYSKNIRVTVNANNYRVITVDRLKL